MSVPHDVVVGPTLGGMSAELTIASPDGGAWTWDDLQAIPDEAYHRFQLIEGQLLTSPSPSRRCSFSNVMRPGAIRS